MWHFDVALRISWQGPAPVRTCRAWACGVLPGPLKECAPFRFTDSVRKATVEGERKKVLMTLLFAAINQKVGKEKKIFLRHTYLTLPSSGSGDIIIQSWMQQCAGNWHTGQREVCFVTFVNFYGVNIPILIKYVFQIITGCLACKFPEHWAIKLLKAGTAAPGHHLLHVGLGLGGHGLKIFMKTVLKTQRQIFLALKSCCTVEKGLEMNYKASRMLEKWVSSVRPTRTHYKVFLQHVLNYWCR